MLRGKSAGVVLYYIDKTPMFLLLKYKFYWGFAKGKVEKGEDDKVAALREVKQETGIENLQIMDGFEYWQKWTFKKGDNLIRKDAVFFLGKVSKEESEKTKISSEHEGFEWLTFQDALKRLKIKNNRDMLHEAYNLIERAGKHLKFLK